MSDGWMNNENVLEFMIAPADLQSWFKNRTRGEYLPISDYATDGYLRYVCKCMEVNKHPLSELEFNMVTNSLDDLKTRVAQIEKDLFISDKDKTK